MIHKVLPKLTKILSHEYLEPYGSSYQVMLLLITTTSSQCFGVTSSCKGTITKLESKNVRLQNLENYEIYNCQAVSSALTLLRCHSPGPSGYKFHRPLAFEVSNHYV